MNNFLKKILCAIICLTSFFPPIKEKFCVHAETPLKTISATATVEHLFTHALISHPEIAFSKGNDYGKNLDEDCLTPIEFRRILSLLYENGYALIDIQTTYEIVDHSAHRISFSFPADKKPLVLSFDDVTYARKNLGKGMSDKLIVNSDGEIAAFTKNSKPQIHQEEFVPILENFIKKHPDFSYNNARGILFLTGFDGILGYRTDRNSENKKSEIEKAKKIVAILKNKGWKFGCHSYSHGHMKKYTSEKLSSDIKKWKNEVECLVGTTPFYAYPYGEWVLGENCSDARAQVLISDGFKLFFGVGSKPFYAQMPLKGDGQKVLFQDRCPMDGISLRRKSCDRLFSCLSVYDNRRPVPFS